MLAHRSAGTLAPIARLQPVWMDSGRAVSSAHSSVEREAPPFIAGGGELGQLIRAYDWNASALGPPENWPQSLKTAVRIMLTSRQPIWIGWGRDLIYLYNTPYKSIIGGKHPWALGRPTKEVWHELWPDIGPMLSTAMTGIEGTYVENQLLIMERNGYPEETYYTFSYSPIPDDDGTPGGIICANTDDTQRVVGERQLALLRDLAALTADARSRDEACERSASALCTNSRDVPFAMIYLAEPNGEQLSLKGLCGITEGDLGAPEALQVSGQSPWPVHPAMAGETHLVPDLPSLFGELPCGSWDQPPNQAVIMPIPASGDAGSAGVLIVGLNPFRLFDEAYRSFLRLVAGQIGGAVANAEAYEQERRRAQALAEIDRAKTIFFSNVSHEFRTPLTLLLGPIEEVLSDGSIELPDIHRQRILTAHRNSLRLLKLVNTLLEFSRIEAGRVEARFVSTDLAEVTAELASSFQSATERAGLVLEVDCPSLPHPVQVDRDMWEKIVLNLLSNAFKYTLEGQIRVTLVTSDDGTAAVLRVADTGVGIPAHEMPRLFERFHRVEGQQGRSFEGSGIGLALVFELVKLHRGTIDAESELGQGTIFTIRIPYGTAHLPERSLGDHALTQPATTLRAEGYVEEALRWLPAPSESTSMPLQRSEELTGLFGASLISDARILIVDDNADMREYMTRLLGSRWKVTTAANGQEALDCLRKETPDLVLSDVMMPILDGFELLRAIRADGSLRDLPVIMLSARAGEEARIEGLNAGADDYLTKPFSARELVARVNVNLELSRVRRRMLSDLRESEARFRNMADNAPVMVWTTDADGVCTYLSRSWYNFTGQTPETGLGFGWIDAAHPDDRAAAGQIFSAANAKREAFRLEYRLRRADGQYRWAMDAAAPRFGEDGLFFGYIGSVIDISERKQAEDTQRLLIGELNHRVKNTLAVVQSMAQHTLRRTKDPHEFVSKFGGRIQSLARVHSMLSASTWQGADVHELVRNQLLHGLADESRILARGPSVHLPPQTTLHLALMLHELGTNASKYGALSGAQGRVTISWRIEGRILLLVWEEQGGPPVHPTGARGFGSTLIEQSSKAEGGTAHMSSTAQGIRWDIALHLTGMAPPQLEAPGSVAHNSGGAAPLDHGMPTAASILAAKRFLVVEDEPILALDVSAALEDAGVMVVAIVATVEDAVDLIANHDIDAAFLDANLNGRPVDDIAVALSERKIPFAFVTGYARESLPKAFPDVAILGKPVDIEQLLETAAKLVQK